MAVLGTVAVDIGLAWVAGCIAIFTWTHGRSSAWASAMRTRHVDGLALAAGWTTLALAFDLWRRSAAAADVPLMAAGSATRTMLVATHYGHAWLVATAAAVLIATTAAYARRRIVHDDRVGPGRWIVDSGFVFGVLFVVLVVARSVVSHAGSGGDVSFAVAMDTIHLATVSSWAGVVWVGAAIRWPTRGDATDARSWLRTLSHVATVALGLILLSGVANTWHATDGSLGALWGSTYGTTLVAKIALVLCAAALGGINRWVFMPRLLADGTPAAGSVHGAFSIVLRIEALVLSGVLLLAATLSNLEPPASM